MVSIENPWRKLWAHENTTKNNQSKQFPLLKAPKKLKRAIVFWTITTDSSRTFQRLTNRCSHCKCLKKLCLILFLYRNIFKQFLKTLFQMAKFLFFAHARFSFISSNKNRVILSFHKTSQMTRFISLINYFTILYTHHLCHILLHQNNPSFQHPRFSFENIKDLRLNLSKGNLWVARQIHLLALYNSPAFST